MWHTQNFQNSQIVAIEPSVNQQSEIEKLLKGIGIGNKSHIGFIKPRDEDCTPIIIGQVTNKRGLTKIFG